ncbi:MAG: DUF3298 domain-containing protein [Lachnospiraceae bacterium]|nr:DUF3298 domain-containing protein [Lachnospiraceae bacterium]
MKKWKKGAALLMAAGLMSTSLTGCGQLLQNAVSAVQEAAESTEASAVTRENTEKTETPAQEPAVAQPAQTATGLPVLEKVFTVAYETSEDYGACLVTGRCESPILAPASAEQYPALATSLDAYTKEQMKSYNDTIADYKEQAEQEYKDAPERFQDGMYYSTNYKVLPQRVDDTVVSFFSSYNDFTGGAHGMYGMQGENFNTQTGEKLMLSDVLNDLSNLNGLIKTELLANYDPEQFDDLDNALSYYDVAVTESTATADNDMGYVFPYNWALTPNGIAFYFGPYALAAYAAGDQMVTLSYDRYADIFNPDYLPVSGNGCMVPFDWTLTGYDINGDGKPNTITLDYDYDENYEAREALRINVDGMGSAATEEGLFGTDYEVTGYYVRTGDGRQYIYATENMENDYQDWYVFDLNGSEITYVDTTWFVRTVEVDSENNVAERMLTNPDDMVLAKRFDFLSSFSAVKDYYAGSDGMPVSDDPYYVVYSDAAQEPLVAKTQLAYVVLDSNGEETGETGELNPGDTFRVYRTDGEKVLDVTLSDGTLGRLTITSADYPCKIDGITDEDCVEQLWYAG